MLLDSTLRSDAHKTFKALARVEPALAPFADVAALITALHGEGPAEPKNRALRALVGAAQTGGRSAQTAQAALILGLWPGLCRVRRRLASRFRGEAALLDAELLGRVTEAIVTLDLDRVSRIAGTIVMNVERDLGRECCRHGRQAPHPPDAFDVVDETCEHLTEPERSMDRVFAARRLDDLFGRDAPLVAAVALYGMTQKEAARALGITHESARKRYGRAISRLEAQDDDGALS